MVLAIDELAGGAEGTVVRKRVFDPDQIGVLSQVFASRYTLLAENVYVVHHEELAYHETATIAHARALDRAAIDDSADEPEDFDVPGDDFGS